MVTRCAGFGGSCVRPTLEKATLDRQVKTVTATHRGHRLSRHMHGAVAGSIPPPLAGEGGAEGVGWGQRTALRRPDPAARIARSHPPLKGEGWSKRRHRA